MLGATQNIYDFDSLFPCVLLGTGILNNEICHFRFMVQRHLRGYSQLCFCLRETATLHQTLKLKILLAKIEKKKKKKSSRKCSSFEFSDYCYDSWKMRYLPRDHDDFMYVTQHAASFKEQR